MCTHTGKAYTYWGREHACVHTNLNARGFASIVVVAQWIRDSRHFPHPHLPKVAKVVQKIRICRPCQTFMYMGLPRSTSICRHACMYEYVYRQAHVNVIHMYVCMCSM